MTVDKKSKNYSTKNQELQHQIKKQVMKKIKYLSLIRGINMVGHNSMKMAELRELYASLKFEEVTTYIQSGNVVFVSTMTDTDKISTLIKAEIQKVFDYDVWVLTMTKETFIKVFEQNPFVDENTENIKPFHVTLLSGTPDEDGLKLIQEKDFGEDVFELGNDCVYLNCPNGYGRTKLTNNFFEKKLKVRGTTRNWRTMTKLFGLL